MERVYVTGFDRDGEGVCGISGVFASRELAEEYAAKHLPPMAVEEWEVEGDAEDGESAEERR